MAVQQCSAASLQDPPDDGRLIDTLRCAFHLTIRKIMIPFSVLDLAPIAEGSDAAQSFRNMLDLAQHAERWRYNRFWLAEHHGMPGIASAATAVLIAHVADGTSRIRVGAGGIMLPNHSPLVIAEQFGTLESLFPGRIDLGLGRAPGSDQLTARALRRNLGSDADEFPQDVVELMDYFSEQPRQPVRAVPGAGLKVPLWILGSSLFGAQLAAALGLPYAFASHFAPAQMMQAIALYRSTFRPSAQLDKPYVMLGFNVIAADTDEEARFLATSMQQAFVNLRSGRPSRLPPPLDGYLDKIGPQERALLDQVLACSAIGSPETVRRELDAFVLRTGADELMITCQVFEHAARLRSYEITAGLH
jgi:luciferase family oxidoreductase group 1